MASSSMFGSRAPANSSFATTRYAPTMANGRSVPTLSSALDACGDEMLVNVEIKNLASDGGFDASMTIARETLDELRRRGANQLGRWLISSFSWATLAACRDYDGRVATAYLCMALDERRIDQIADCRPRCGASVGALGHVSLVERCHSAGLLVNVWTSNDPGRLVELAALGVDGVCTDVPAIARTALGRLPVASTTVPTPGDSASRRTRRGQPLRLRFRAVSPAVSGRRAGQRRARSRTRGAGCRRARRRRPGRGTGSRARSRGDGRPHGRRDAWPASLRRPEVLRRAS